jgi:hypothetical protein
MQLKQAWAHADYFTGKASELVRQLAFAGIAVVWVFKNNTQTAVIPNDFVLALFCLVLTLLCDFLQYAFGGIEWRGYGSYQAKKHGGSDDDEIDDAPQWLNYPHTFCYYAKLVLIVASYALLISGVSARL